jgi:predicted transcriptional regulator
MINQNQSTRPQIVNKTKDGKTTKQTGMKYRSRMQIIGEILTATASHTGGLTKTKIMYKSYLSYAQLKDYLSAMLVDDLLSFNEKTSRLTVTGKGFAFLENYRKIAELVPEVDLCENSARSYHL